MLKYNAESPKQGSRRFNSIVKTKYIDDLGIVYLCRSLTIDQQPGVPYKYYKYNMMG